ncbi:hypothetical protein HG536_0G02120 [Torulaspora globosa]|uniref:Thioredoxin domain-containing protein n=1 Tax=Torulaspora globosa TaxID=48254 RepID=A0A7G3ZLG7_9SACH|nr:uncharacterized protein HG536_0G02120 [Torulaspora globosa]QLL34353.1 hypothetical protein HG536_0G02120 [Torulaspora globosa]
MVARLIPFLLLVSILLGFGQAKQGPNTVDLVMSLDQYYDAVNSNESYTMVEYTTSWCHHCKKLAPNFVQLKQSFDADTAKPPVRFLEVNCEIFGTTICSGFPGFPMIHLIQPRTKPLEMPDQNQPVPLWRRIFNYLTSKYTNPRWQLDPDRVIEYRGSRDPESMKSFIEAVRKKDKLLRAVNRVLDESYDCNSEPEEQDKQLCEYGKKFIRDTERLSNEDLAKERLKLENILQHNKELKDNLKVYNEVKLKLQLLNQLLVSSSTHDEL